MYIGPNNHSQLASALPSSSKSGIQLTNSLLSTLWNDLDHPPLSYVYPLLKGRGSLADGV